MRYDAYWQFIIKMNIKDNTTYAIIPARSGSKAVKDKNIREINGHPLLSYTIALAKNCPSISRTIVSTDSSRYKDIAEKYGAEVPFLRPQDISGSDSQDIEYLSHAINKINKLQDFVPEFFVLLRPTTPIRRYIIVEKAIKLLKENKDGSAVVSISETKECPYKYAVIGKSGYLENIIPNKPIDEVNLPRQGFQKSYYPNGYVDVIRTKTIMDGCVYGKNAIPYLVEESIDIDTEDDFTEVLKINSFEPSVLEYLEKRK